MRVYILIGCSCFAHSLLTQMPVLSLFQLFLDLKGLLERYIIIKTEDEAVEGDTATAGTH